MIFWLFSPTLHDLLLRRTCDGVGWGGDNTKQICCTATWSSCFSLLRYMIFLVFAPTLHDLLGFFFSAIWSLIGCFSALHVVLHGFLRCVTCFLRVFSCVLMEEIGEVPMWAVQLVFADVGVALVGPSLTCHFDMDHFLDLLTLLLLLRAAYVSFPPLFIAWSRVETPEMNDLHQLLPLSKHGDALARKTLECVWSHYDRWSLLKGQAVLKQTWKHFVRKHQPMPAPVLEAVEWLERRRVGPRNPHFDCDDEALAWNRLCELQLTHVHDPALARETASQSEPGLLETILGLPAVVDNCTCWSCCCCRSCTFAACCSKVFCRYCFFGFSKILS